MAVPDADSPQDVCHLAGVIVAFRFEQGGTVRYLFSFDVLNMTLIRAFRS